MKKLLISASLLLIPSVTTTIVWADAVTSGSVGFLTVTTGAVDPRRRYDDKENANWRIAAATITNVLGQISAINTATGTFLQNGAGVIQSTHIAAGVLWNNGEGVIFSTNIANGEVRGVDVAAGTLSSTHTIRGVEGGVLPDNTGVIFSTHFAAGILVGDNFGSHRSTQAVMIGTNTAQAAGLTISTAIGFPGPIFTVRRGTAPLFEVTGTSVSVQGSLLENGLQVLNGSASTQTKAGGLEVLGGIRIGGTSTLGQAVANTLIFEGNSSSITVGAIAPTNSVGGVSLVIQSGPKGSGGDSTNSFASSLILKTGEVANGSGGRGGAIEFHTTPRDSGGGGTAYGPRLVGKFASLKGYLVLGTQLTPDAEHSILSISSIATITDGNGLLAITTGTTTPTPVFIVNNSSAGFGPGISRVTMSDANLGVGTSSPSSRVEVLNGSITVRGTNSGVRVSGLSDCGSITTDVDGNFICGGGGGIPIIVQDEGTDQSTATVINFVGAGVTVTNTQSTITVTIAGGAGGGDNQAVNTSTGPLLTLAFGPVGGAVFLATSPFVSIPGKVFNTFLSTFNVKSIQGYTMVVSTALDANITMRIAQSTSAGVGFGAFSYISSSATVISSSDTTTSDGGWRYGVEYSTSFKMFPRMEYALHVTSVPSGGALPAENFGINVNGWWSP